MNLRSALLIFALLFGTSMAHAEPIPLWNSPNVTDDPRTIALGGAVTTIGTSWSALNHNPAGMNQIRQYVSNVGYGAGGDPMDHSFTVAATDSLMNPAVSMGMSYTRLVLTGNSDQDNGGGNIFRGALVFSERGEGLSFHFGTSFHHSSLDLPSSDLPSETSDEESPATSISAFNMNAGFLLVIANKFRVGVLGRNLLSRLSSGQSRDYVSGVGLVLGPAALEYSATFDFETCDAHPQFCAGGSGLAVSHATGVEFTPTIHFPIRFGYRYDTIRDQHVVSGGFGFISTGFSLEGAYARDVAGSDEQWLGVTIRYFPNIPGT